MNKQPSVKQSSLFNFPESIKRFRLVFLINMRTCTNIRSRGNTRNKYMVMELDRPVGVKVYGRGWIKKARLF